MCMQILLCRVLVKTKTHETQKNLQTNNNQPKKHQPKLPKGMHGFLYEVSGIIICYSI